MPVPERIIAIACKLREAGMTWDRTVELLDTVHDHRISVSGLRYYVDKNYAETQRKSKLKKYLRSKERQDDNNDGSQQAESV
jgi:hypothetical protein